MDWAKAKNILIIAFIITNIFLGYYAIKDWKANNHNYSITEEKIHSVTKVLENKNIIVNAHIPKEIYELRELTVEYETYDISEIENKIFEGRKKDYREQLKILANDKLISYSKRTIAHDSKDISEEDAKKIANDFIERIGFKNEEVVFWQIEKNDKEYKIQYKQKYENIILDDGYMKIRVKNGEVVGFERRWLNPIDVKVMNKTVIPATKTLLLAMDQLKERKEKEDSEVIITDINLVYSLNIFEINKFLDEEWYEGNEKTGFLYWRIRLENNDYIDIEAYE